MLNKYVTLKDEMDLQAFRPTFYFFGSHIPMDNFAHFSTIVQVYSDLFELHD
jgi:hypothetical protein